MKGKNGEINEVNRNGFVDELVGDLPPFPSHHVAKQMHGAHQVKRDLPGPDRLWYTESVRDEAGDPKG
ncbi:hypothetical protein D3C76_1708440 [compost metagenome]